MTDNYLKILFMIIMIASIYACTSDITPSPDTPVPVSLTSTSGINVISSSSAQDIVLLKKFQAHSKRVLDIHFSARGEHIVSTSQDMNIKVWDTTSLQEVHTFSMASVDMAYIDVSIRDNLLATGEAIWDLQSMDEVHQLERGSQFPAFVAFSPDGLTLALGIFDKEVNLIDVSTGERKYTFPDQGENRTKRLAFSPDGKILAAGVIDGTVRLWDADSGEPLKVLHYSGETDIHGIAFSPNGNYLVTGGRVPAVVLWDVATGEIVRTFRLRDNVLNVAFSPDGSILATAGGFEKAILLWDVASGDLLQTLPHNDQSMAVAFSHDGRHLAVGCFDGQIYLWGFPTQP